MGILKTSEPQAQAPSRSSLRHRRPIAGQIGSVPKRSSASVTTFTKRKDEWFFGPEAPVTFDLTTRTFLRAGPPKRTIDFFRYEISLSLDDARTYGLLSGHRIVIADMPLGQRRFQTTRLQKYAGDVQTAVFEDLAMTGMPAGSAARFALTDMEAIGILHRLPVNIFGSRRALTAAIAGTEAGCFIDYEDFDANAAFGKSDCEMEGQAAARRVRPLLTARDRFDGYYAFGIVSDLDTIRGDLWRHPTLRAALDSIGRGTYRIPLPGGKMSIGVPLEVAARSVDHFNVAVFQALAGAGRTGTKWFDRPVHRYVRDLFHAHLLVAIDRFDGRIIPPGAIDPDIPDIPYDPKDPGDDGDGDIGKPRKDGGGGGDKKGGKDPK